MDSIKKMDQTAEDHCEQRLKRTMDAVQCNVPDRVPIFLPISAHGAVYGGITLKEAFGNLPGWYDINEKMVLDYSPDFFLGPVTFDMKANALVGNKLARWPGNGLDDNTSVQFVEGEYMKAEEYDAFLEDPGSFILGTYLPRIYSGLEGFLQMPSLMSLFNGMGGFMFPGGPEAVIALENLAKAARHLMQYRAGAAAFADRMESLGFPKIVGFGAQAPFDVVSDYLRGLYGSTLDMFRCPDKMMAAQEKFIPYLIQSATASGKRMGLIHFCALHRGSDEFMSAKQFGKFYWPGWKKVLLAMIDSGMTPFVFWEGAWNYRLEYLKELPKGKVVGWFDRTDLFKAKKVIGDTMCICGDMPLSLLQTGTPEKVKDYAKKLIDEVGREGGFVMTSSTVLDHARPELVRAWVEFTKEYGVYQ